MGLETVAVSAAIWDMALEVQLAKKVAGLSRQRSNLGAAGSVPATAPW
jgi:hypothetical protein